MDANVGMVDRGIRLAASVLFIFACLRDKDWTGKLAGIALAGSGVLISSTITGFCPLYKVLGINTKE